MSRIVEATKKDLPQILKIEREAISPPWSHESLLDEICKADSCFLTAVDNGDIVGFAVIRQVGDDGELLQIAVDRSARRCGVGDLLMRAVLGYAEKSALKSVFLEVRCGNEAAIHLYEKHGFEKVRTRKGYYNEPVEDALVMIKGMA